MSSATSSEPVMRWATRTMAAVLLAVEVGHAVRPVRWALDGSGSSTTASALRSPRRPKPPDGSTNA